jgi:diketogulonate reductase-like aldo/keto reductase
MVIRVNDYFPGPSSYTSSTSLTKTSLNGEIGRFSIGPILKYDSLGEVATKKGATMAQIALAWSMAQDLITAPIVGTTSLKNLQDLLSMHSAINLRIH